MAPRDRRRIVLSPAQPRVGGSCSTDVDCDPSGYTESTCSLTTSPFGPIFPTPTCINVWLCAPSEPTTLGGCGENGVCLHSVCVPRCTFLGTDGLPPKGCLGKNGCVALAKNVGACFGGCTADADCPAASKCQLETAWCVTKLVTYSKAVGAKCSTTETDVCNCVAPPGSTDGYCTQACQAGASSCPTGFACDVGLPPADYPYVPPGLFGHCAKSCSDDTDCPAGTCAESAGAGRVCVVGPALRTLP